MSSAFIDTNVIIKYFTGNPMAKKVLEPVVSGEITGYINNIVFSEVLFVLVKLLTGMKAYELKKKPKTIKETLKRLDKQIVFLQEYLTELELSEEIKQAALDIMKHYGLLPNDAIIVATCKHYGINTLLTFDQDFKRIPWLKVTP
ncbi:MAG: PIN domain-containing protein [Desulfurococcales archaeon]|nr:PIN domain-containing protein [Desulfurococcales archaeon]